MPYKSFFLLLIIGLCFANSAESQTSAPMGPTAPAAPAAPVVPGADPGRRLNEFPLPPPIPEAQDQNNGSARIIDSYELTVIGAYPNGNLRNNAANTIIYAQYVLYSNRTMEIKLSFSGGSDYVYHLRNPRNRVEINPGIFREIYDTNVQVDNRFLLDRYISELNYNDSSIISFNLLNDNKVVVLLNVRRK